MRNQRRMRRLQRVGNKAGSGLNLTSLMDIFTILLLYLLVNQSDTPLEPPKNVKLPDSIVETKPRETLVVTVNAEQVIVKGEPVVSMEDVLASDKGIIAPIRDRMTEIRESSIGLGTEEEDKSTEVTIMADRKVHYSIMKRVMASCTAAGYTKISLAVNQK
ncbi:MAG: biopolymer transporter ExbD [Pseudomonadota bacterium]|jgi:biopolymer transport protein ExbD|uniref:ExbD/TolR family protein n=1 Tax=Alcanivorax sp. TaxID=1872427 RepID=UPI0025B8EA6A|nr:biopolymer transporter ExbD [Alcanivorax sp.]MED5239985.1 biopolymer transporter ExbD [Pseudomonadota bacterium]MEE3320854.1 biopolymer transporter ExbD [Pseudomonadota bacterium]